MRALILALGLLVVAAVPAGMQAPAVKIILGATVINPTSAVPAAAVVITGARITQVAPAATFKPPALAETIDARGKFVIPGLADMHNHLGAGGMSLGPQRENYVGNLGRLLAAGVTTVFNPDVGEGEFTTLKSASALDTAASAQFFGTGPAITVPGAVLGSTRLPAAADLPDLHLAAGRPVVSILSQQHGLHERAFTDTADQYAAGVCR